MKTKAEGGGKGAAQLPKVAVLFSACFHGINITQIFFPCVSLFIFRVHFSRLRK
jgi:hypothetical protein